MNIHAQFKNYMTVKKLLQDKTHFNQDEVKRLQNQIDSIVTFEAEKKRKIINLIQERKLFVVKSTDDSKQKWDLVVMILAIFNCFFVPI